MSLCIYKHPFIFNFSSLQATAELCTEVKPCSLETMFMKNIPQITNTFNILFKVGSGTFGSVYAASLKNHSSKLFAIKHIVPYCSLRRIQNEIECLSLLDNQYVISLETFFRHNDHVVLVMPFFEHNSFQEYVKMLTVDEVQVYMKSLFFALATVHNHDIIHRDIKPSNVLFNYKTKTLKLIDFGLSHKESISMNGDQTGNVQTLCLRHCDHKVSEICNLCRAKPNQLTPRAGSSGFRAFEVLLKCQNQSTALDIWSAGIIFLCLLSGTYPFFKPNNDMTAIIQIITLFGSQKCVETAQLLGKELCCSPYKPSQNLSTVCQQLRSNFSNSSCDTIINTYKHTDKSSWIAAPPAAYELLEHCLELNPLKRISALEAINHNFLNK